jgi:very-short-patch-repair endonuclease
MRRDGLVRQQTVSPAKAKIAKDLRRKMTASEAALWQRLKANRLDGRHFRRQQIIAGYIADFYCHSAGLVVEVDGEIHRRQQEEDASRDAGLRHLGLRVLRIAATDVEHDIDAVVDRVRAALVSAQSPTPDD